MSHWLIIAIAGIIVVGYGICIWAWIGMFREDRKMRRLLK